MASVIIGMEADEIAIQDPKQDLATDGKDPNEVVPSVSFPGAGIVV